MSFASFHLDSLEIDPAHKDACRRAGYATAADVLLAAPLERARKFRNMNVVPDKIVSGIVRALAPAAVPLSTVPDPCLIRTGDDAIDGLLRGGVRSGSITELTGESAAGKSHMTLMLALAAQHPDLSSHPGGAIMVSSERVLETSRLIQLAGVLRAKYGGPTVKQLLDNIHTSRVADIEALDHALAFVVPVMLQRAKDAAAAPAAEGTPGPLPTRILIIDSLTALLRGETERSSAGLAQRSRFICTIADRLKALSAEFNIACVVVNQVKDVFGPEPGAATQVAATQLPESQYPVDDILPPMLYATQAAHFSGMSPGVNKEAALGIVWANAVNTRIMLARTGRRRMLSVEDVVRGKRQRTGSTPNGSSRPSTPSPAIDEATAIHLALETDKPTLIRRMHLVFSPIAAPAMGDYILTQSGIHGIAGSFRPVDLGPALRRRDIRLRAAIAERRAEEKRDRGEALSQPTASAPPSSLPLTQKDDIDDVYDDLGELPPEFWAGVDQYDSEAVAVGVVD